MTSCLHLKQLAAGRIIYADRLIDAVINGGVESAADINGDNSIDLLDVAPFADLLTGG